MVTRSSGIWTSDPTVLASYGPVLLAALLAALLLGLGTMLERRFRGSMIDTPARPTS